MKSLSTVLAALLCAASPILAEESPKAATEQPAQPVRDANLKIGADAITMIRMAYENGEFDSFLKEMDESYTQAKSENGLKGLIEMRSGSLPDSQKWDLISSQLQSERNTELLKSISQDDHSLTADKVRSVTAASQENPLYVYRHLTPGSGKNGDENKLIDLDLEYEYKAIHLYRPGEKQTDLREKYIALQMEKMNKMRDAASQFEDEALKKAVESTTDQLDASLARHWDATDLNVLAKKKAKPTTLTDEKVVSILNSYQAKFNDLAKQYIESESPEAKQ